MKLYKQQFNHDLITTIETLRLVSAGDHRFWSDKRILIITGTAYSIL